MNYLLHIVAVSAIYSILALATNILLGHGGMLSLSAAAFYGLGAYTTAILTMRSYVEFPLALVAAMALTGAVAWLAARPILRLRGDLFVLGTLGLQVLVQSFLANATSLTGGTQGIGGIPSAAILGLTFDSPAAFAALAGLVTIATIALFRLVEYSPFGLLLQSTRDDAKAAEALGKDVGTIRQRAFVLSAAVSGAAGALYAGYARYVDPSSFGTLESIFIISCVVLGGAGSSLGCVLGAVVLVVFPELLRSLHIHDGQAAQIRQLLYGVLLILCLRWRSQGLFGKYRFD